MAAATTTFIALQCCQCSTMQVKQQKKSSNKWTCVVCNQKQSMRKVFARSFMAKDVRKFVQSFNMSRLSSDLEVLDPQLEGVEAEGGVVTNRGDGKKLKRSDWSEYLDVGKEVRADEEEDDGGMMKIVTELPKEIFKKPKLKEFSCQSAGLKGGKLFTPSFTKRSIRKPTTIPDKEPKKKQNGLAFRNSDWTNSKRESDINPMITPSTAAVRDTKWSNYMSQDEVTLRSRMCKDDGDRFSNGVLEATTNDQKVEEDIHPEFM